MFYLQKADLRFEKKIQFGEDNDAASEDEEFEGTRKPAAAKRRVPAPRPIFNVFEPLRTWTPSPRRKPTKSQPTQQTTPPPPETSDIMPDVSVAPPNYSSATESPP